MITTVDYNKILYSSAGINTDNWNCTVLRTRGNRNAQRIHDDPRLLETSRADNVEYATLESFA